MRVPLRTKVRMVSAMWLLFLAVSKASAQATQVFDRSNLSAQQYFEQRVQCQIKLEDLRWSYRIWPDENKSTNPSRSTIISDAKIRARVADNMAMENALSGRYGIHIGSKELQKELERMASKSKYPSRLQELFHAFDNNPTTVAECLVRPFLVEQRLNQRFSIDDVPMEEDFSTWWDREKTNWTEVSIQREVTQDLILPIITHTSKAFAGAQDPDRWLIDETPSGRISHSAIWTGSEMIIWGGAADLSPNLPGRTLNTGYRYDPVSDSWSRISETGAPTGRRRHTTIWTGAEMIVWGGYTEEERAVSDGGRYNPLTDTWTTISAIDVPMARRDHTAIWTGNEMIVWGGRFFSGSNIIALNDGGRYDPGTDNWSTIETIQAPNPRYAHTAVWSGSEMIIWGGREGSASEEIINSGGRYNPNSNSWLPVSVANAPSARLEHGSVWTGTEMLIWGGLLDNTGGLYDPINNAWRAMSMTNAPPDCAARAMKWVDPEMFVWCGRFQDAQGHRYNPSTDQWSPMSNPGFELGTGSNNEILWTGEELIVWGGRMPPQYISNGGRYNPATDTWQAMTSTMSPYPRVAHKALWTGAEMIVFGSGLARTGGRYYPETDTWLSTALSNSACSNSPTLLWTGLEMIVWDISSRFPTDCNVGNASLSGLYDPVNNNWGRISEVNQPQIEESEAVWTGEYMLAWGKPLSGSSMQGGRYDPELNTWQSISEMNAPPVRTGFGSVWTGEDMLIWGGCNGINCFNDGAFYNLENDSWTLFTGTNAPSIRTDFSTVWTGSELLIWGGSLSAIPDVNDYVNEGWLYEPTTDSWTEVSQADVPSARYGYSMIWNGMEMMIWGGCSAGADCRDISTDLLDDGYRYNLSLDQWSAMTMTNAPFRSYFHSAVWADDFMLTWGGFHFNEVGAYFPNWNSELIFADGFESISP